MDNGLGEKEEGFREKVIRWEEPKDSLKPGWECYCRGALHLQPLTRMTVFLLVLETTLGVPYSYLLDLRPSGNKHHHSLR